MSPLLIILLVCFTMVMFLWLLGLLGAVGPENSVRFSPWLAFFACLILGIVIFLTGGGYLTVIH